MNIKTARKRRNVWYKNSKGSKPQFSGGSSVACLTFASALAKTSRDKMFKQYHLHHHCMLKVVAVTTRARALLFIAKTRIVTRALQSFFKGLSENLI